MTTSIQLQRTVLILALSSIYPLLANATAGVAQFIAGDVNVRGADGKTDALLKGRDIESGQAIVTGANGRAQVKFTDGGLISLQPNTEFKIANYVDKADPQQDRFLVDLLRGSMRAITGLIGKRNRANYKVTTTTATIGIRGSGFSAGYNPDGSLGVTAEKDAIEVCSGGTCVGVVAGESVRVNSSSEPPVRTVNRASVPTPGPAQEVVTTGNQTSSDGKSTVKDPRPATVTTATTVIAANAASGPVQRTFTDVAVSIVGTDTSLNVQRLSTSAGANTTFIDHKLLTLTDTSMGNPKWSESGTAKPVSSFQAINSVTDTNFIGWGTWTKGLKDTINLDQVHYIAGRPTPNAQMPVTGSANYAFAGGTTTRINAAGIAVGSFTAANTHLNVDFVNSSLTASIQTSFIGVFTENVTFTSGQPVFNGTIVNGFFTGANASHAGLTFVKPITAGDNITGAIVFTKQ